MNKFKVRIMLDKRQVLNDVSGQLAIIGRILSRNQETEDQGSDLMWPESPLNKPIVARAMTEALGQIKSVCAAYLVYGKDEDDNRLEAMDKVVKHQETLQKDVPGTYDLVIGIKHLIRVESAGEITLKTTAGKTLGTFEKKIELEYTPGITCRLLSTDKARITYFTPVYGAYELVLAMPATYNSGLTESMKSCAHRMMVDYILQSLLMHHYPEKSSVYTAKFMDDAEGLRIALRSRVKYGRRAEDWA